MCIRDRDEAARTVTITTPQDFYSMEKFSAYARALKSPIEELNDQICPLPDKVKGMGLPELLSDRHFVLNLEQFEPKSEGLTLPAPSSYITITITSPDGTYEHSSVAHSIENHQGHYYLPMDWLEYLFNARVSYNEAANILSIQTPDPEQIKSEIARIENVLIPDSADEAIKLWGRGMQTRNGALQYAALSPQLRQEADQSPYVRQSCLLYTSGYLDPRGWFSEAQISELENYMHADLQPKKAGDLWFYEVDLQGFWLDGEMVIPDKITVNPMYASTFDEQGNVRSGGGAHTDEIVYTSGYKNTRDLPYFSHGDIGFAFVQRSGIWWAAQSYRSSEKQAGLRQLVTDAEKLKETKIMQQLERPAQRIALTTYRYYLSMPYQNTIQGIDQKYYSDFWTVIARDINMWERCSTTLVFVWIRCV